MHVYAGALGVGALVAFLGTSQIARLIEIETVAAAVRADGPIWGTILAAAALLGTMALRAPRPLAAIAAMALVPPLITITAQDVLHAAGEDRSARSLADAIRASRPPGSRVLAVEVYPASLSYYLRERILVATDWGSDLKSNYIDEYAAQLRERPDSSLRPGDWWLHELRQCTTPTIFVVKAGHREHRAPLAAALPAIAEGPRYAAYGPCEPGRS